MISSTSVLEKSLREKVAFFIKSAFMYNPYEMSEDGRIVYNTLMNAVLKVAASGDQIDNKILVGIMCGDTISDIIRNENLPRNLIKSRLKTIYDKVIEEIGVEFFTTFWE